jgi:hypothetical protein
LEEYEMLRHLVCSAAILLASWSIANASHAGLSINLPGFGLNLPLPGVGISIGLPVVAAPAYPSYYRVEMNEPSGYARYYGNGRYYGDSPAYYRTYRNDYYYGDRADFNRSYRRDRARDFDRYPGRYGVGNYR